jgi:glycosyltransferase involved in cell wall biosynthesis
LEKHERDYHSIVFIPYLYGTTLAGIPAVADRAFLQPCLHDEAYAYLPAVSEAVHSARGLLLNSEGEFEIALRLFGPGIIPKSFIVGQGVDDFPVVTDEPERVGSFSPRHEHYVLYLGRQDPAKNIGLLVHAFGEFKRRHPMSRLKLVLAGQRPTSYGDTTKDIIDVGPVGEAEKVELLRHMRALVQPSLMESYSRVMIEAWLFGKPVIVHEDCLATATVVQQIDGGLRAGPTTAWEASLYTIDVAEQRTLDAMGERGAAYAHRAADWELVIDNYERALGFASPSSPVAATNGSYANGASNGAAKLPAIDPRVWDRDADRPLAKALQDGCTNLIYVGALAAIEPLNQLLTTFLHYLTLDRESRLVLVGRGDVHDDVYERLYAEVRSLDLADHVLLARDVLLPQLQAVYRTASLFWSLDEVAPPIEGFLEAMWFDVPILAYKSPAAEKVVGEAGILLREKDDLLSVAVLAQMVATDRTLRDRIVAAQRAARGRYRARGLNVSSNDEGLRPTSRRMALERL